MVLQEQCQCVGIIAADSVSSLPTDEFLRRADTGIKIQFHFLMMSKINFEFKSIDILSFLCSQIDYFL